jgi:plastocyanin
VTGRAAYHRVAAPGLAGLAGTLLVLFAAFAEAQGIAVTVTDSNGMPVPDVAVFIDSPGTGSRATPGTRAVMDQVNERFVPHVLVVQTGTEVDFPNSDIVAHHVYSFSHPNHFKLPMYKGNAHPPVRFEESGIVVLGCNIHDNMLAYIVVVDTPLFAMTDANGAARFTMPVEGARVSIWSPRIRDPEKRLTVELAGARLQEPVAFRLEKSLRPPHRDGTEALTWSEY